MIDKNGFRPIEDLPIGSYVDVSDIANMQKVKIISINNSGTAIKGDIGEYVTISNKSPARPSDNQEIVTNKPGRRKGVSAEVIMPEGDLPFTIKQLAELNEGLNTSQITAFIKENCEIAGEAERVIGQRGKTAKTYKLI